MYKLSLFLLITFTFFQTVLAQDAAIQHATLVAQKIKDTLFLSLPQRDSIYAINIRLQNQKSQARSRYTGTDSLQYHIQRIENTRDSLYKGVIADDNKYGLYKQKKRYLVSNN